MKGQANHTSSAATGGWWLELKPILFLILFAFGLRAWQLTHTEVTARDSYTYIHTAWRLEHEPWTEVLRSCFQHPGYPLTVLAAAAPARALLPNDLPGAMQLAAQLASAIAGVLLVIPAFLLGRELFDRRVCFWAGLLLQCLPSTGRLMADGLSEPLFLLVTSTSLLGSARGLRTGSVGWFVLGGGFGALAYLTRPEGVLLVGVAGLILLVQILAGRWTGGTRRGLVCGSALAASALVIALPYMVVIGGFTVKPSVHQIMEAPKAAAAPARLGAAALPLAAWIPDWKPGAHGSWDWALPALTAALARGFFYVLWAPALLGLWRHRHSFTQPTAWLLLLTCLGVAAAVAKIAEHLGYVSDRHLMLLLFAGMYWSAAGLLLLGDGLAAVVAWWKPFEIHKGRWIDAVALLPLVLACAVPLARTLEVLHCERQGFRAAGYWLAENAQPGAEIVDPFTWTNYYAGRPFHAATPPGTSDVAYVVVEEGKSVHSHLPEVADAAVIAKYGDLLKSWNVPRGRVSVYEVPARFVPRRPDAVPARSQ
jgi:asparagine N-glycosylation enzyme membrane subunit Stt3